jgi:shikimate dehydrogenase
MRAALMGVPYAEVIGDPIAHSKSPAIHKFWLRKLGIEADYRAVRVAGDELRAYLEARREDPDWRGCNVTLPLKAAAVPLVDELRVWGSVPVNCIVPEEGRLVGHNTDMTGIGRICSDIPDRPICLIGSGGAARAAIAALDIAAFYRFNLIVRDIAKARPVVAPYGENGRLFGFEAAAEAMQGCSGLINASPLGMDGFEPMPKSLLDSLGSLGTDAFVFEMVYAPVETELLRRAAALGLKTVDGLEMLIGQAEHAFQLFFGKPPPAAHEAELRELLIR